jgi:hypothetical protein
MAIAFDHGTEAQLFDYGSPAELFTKKGRTFRGQPFGYRRFDCATDAIRRLVKGPREFRTARRNVQN